MQLAATDDTAPRYYHLHLQKDLLEGWSLVREWGFQGAGGRVRKEHFAGWEQAQQALIKVRDEQLRRGYRIVFVQGHEKP